MKLGPFPSRIVRSVGCAALTLLLAATTCPTFGAPTARAMESLSAAQLSRLPDGTLIKLKTGRTVSLGILRSEHKLRLQRFADAAKLGKEHGASVPATHGVYAVPEAHRLTPQGTLVPMDFSPQRFGAAWVQNYWPLPADFLAFCRAALTTACLYLPSGVPLFLNGLPTIDNYTGAWQDLDPFITDSQVCRSEGGIEYGGGNIPFLGCAWAYPLAYSLNFNPGQPTAQGYYVGQSVSCPSPFVNTVDPHGYVAVSSNTNNPGVAPDINGAYTFPSLQTCVVSLFVK